MSGRTVPHTSQTVSVFQWPEYHAAVNIHPLLRPRLVDFDSGPRGVAWGRGPFQLEFFWDDVEPQRRERPYTYLQVWSRLHRNDIPQGWRPLPFGLDKQYFMMGYCELRSDADYFAHWPKTTRYDRRLWRSEYLDKIYALRNITYEEYETGYAKSRNFRELNDFDLRKLRQRIALFPANISLWGVYRLEDNALLAGLAALYSPEHNASALSSSFYLSESKKNPVMIGLYDHWFQHAIGRGVRTISLGAFWREPSSNRERGINQFKSGFITHAVAHQPMIARLITN